MTPPSPKWNVPTHVEPQIVTTSEMGQCADNLKAQPVDQHRRPERRPSREQGFLQFATQNNHIPSLRSVQFIQPPAVLQGQVADLVELWFNPENGAARTLILADLAQIVARNNGTGPAYVRRPEDL